MNQATLRVVSSAERLRLDPQQASDHIDRLFRAAWALCGSREDAEDLVQETYARVLAKPRFLRSEDDLGYLLRRYPRSSSLRRKRGLASTRAYVSCTRSSASSREPHNAQAARNSRSMWSLACCG